MIKSIIIVALVAVLMYSYITNTSVKTIIKQNDITFQNPVKISKS